MEVIRPRSALSQPRTHQRPLNTIEILNRPGSRTLSTSSHTADLIFDDGLPISAYHPLREFTRPARTFPLLQLPVELQRLVFYHCFGGPYDITLENERLTMLRSRFHVLGMPSVDLLLASKHIHAQAGPIRTKLFTGRLVLNSVFILVPLRRQERFQWLRGHIRILHFSDSSVHPERWATYFDSLTKLRRLEINFREATRLDIGEGSLQTLAEGRHDELLLKRIDRLRLVLVHQLRQNGRFEIVVRQKYGAKDEDAYLMVEIQLSEAGEKIVSRELVVEKQTGTSVKRRPAELIHANGNVLDSGSLRSLFDWHQAMSS